MEFEWDDAKAEANLRKHGVSFDEAATAFADPLAAIFPDPDHSEGEPREILVGFALGAGASPDHQLYRAPTDPAHHQRQSCRPG